MTRTTITDRRRAATAAVLTALAVGTAGCGASAQSEDLQVLVSFAPLAYLAERIAGPEAEITNLTPPGADPHGQELSPSAIADLGQADLFVYVSGLQSSVDAALEQTAPERVVDTLEAATAPVEGAATPPEAGRDPHFWLDPVRFGLAAGQVANALAEVDPDHADDYRERADALIADLTDLDTEYATALAPCAGSTVVTAHEAFGYLTARYGLEQVGVTGIDPEVEPSPARLREVRTLVEETGVRTLYFETAADPGVAEQLAADLGIETAVLDPMERPADPDYLVVMDTNLEALTTGLVCD